MTVRRKFVFVAGAAALDFLNTEVMRGGQPVDLLHSFDDVAAWIDEAGLARGKALIAGGPASPTAKRRLLHELRGLRTALRTVAERLAAGAALCNEDLTTLNRALARGRGAFAVSMNDDDLSLAFKPDASAATDPVYLIAREAAQFLDTADLELVRRCEGTGCILFFYDTTKSHTRRWCSMSGCGNRMKAALFYQRNKKGGKVFMKV